MSIPAPELDGEAGPFLEGGEVLVHGNHVFVGESGMATNGLAIDAETYITDPLFERDGREVQARGVTVEYVDFAVSRLFGGAFRCSTQPLGRFD
ncbi:hypothetical protein [Nocardia cyriacigeorgica]|uniref:hypothetical protein n=1 Tax=Nocardia cyriacigeorgica TaxID=135487 RepID=UPI001895E4B9|nr:hypothetical protein [Nocardia cyriacigeorgica]MBF6435166.1 hypothetical protein [Nocardia cyriacigeorgica]